MTDDSMVLTRLRSKLGLPGDAPRDKVVAALDTVIMQRAAAVGLSATATLPEVLVAEQKAAAAAAVRRVAAAQMLGHAPEPAAVEEFHPALQPVSRTPRNTNEGLDWAAIIAEADE